MNKTLALGLGTACVIAAVLLLVSGYPAASAALFVAGKVKSIAEGWQFAAEVIDDGRAKSKLAALQG